MRPGLTAGALGPSIVLLNTNKSPPPPLLSSLVVSFYSAMCVFITAVPITKLFARGEGGMEDMCYERLRAEATPRRNTVHERTTFHASWKSTK